MEASSILAALIAVLSVIAAALLPPPRAIALVAALCFGPFFRVSLPLGSTDLGLRPEDAALAVLFCRALFTKKPRLVSPLSHRFFVLYTCLALMVMIGTVYSFLHYDVETISFYTVQKMLGVSAMFFVTHRLLSTEADCKTALAGAVLGGIALCIAVLLSNATPSERGDSFMFDREMYDMKERQMQFLPAWNPNVIGLACGLLTITAVFISANGRRRTIRLGAAAVSIFFLYILLRSYTRTSIVSFAVTIAYLAFRTLGSRGRGGRWVVAAVMLAGLAVIPSLRREAFQISLADDINTGSRLLIWSAATNAVLASPFGYGVGAGDLGIEQYFGIRASAHNDWLDFALDLGIVGGIWALLTFSTLGWSLYQHARGYPGLSFHAAGWCFFLFSFVESFSHQVFVFSKQPFILLAISLALTSRTRLRLGGPKALIAGELLHRQTSSSGRPCGGSPLG